MVEVTSQTGTAAQFAVGTGCVITHLSVHDAAGAIEFYKEAFGAVEEMRAPAPDGKRIWHAALTLGSTRLFLADDFSEQEGMTCASPRTLGGTSTALYFYVPDADAAFDRAVAAG
ncbi:MAG: VOC family protein, partial [Chloroflexota bacterium]|nr:VOC family protein [Chloroflexota bacterium]